MIKGTVFIANENDVREFANYCKEHKIEMRHVGEIEFDFIMKSKRLEKFLRFVDGYDRGVYYIMPI